MKVNAVYKVSTFFKLELILIFIVTLLSIIYVINESRDLVFTVKNISDDIACRQDSVIQIRSKTINFLIKDDRYFTRDSINSSSYGDFSNEYRQVLDRYYINDSNYKKLDSLMRIKSKLQSSYKKTFDGNNIEDSIISRSSILINNSEVNEAIYEELKGRISLIVSTNNDNIERLKKRMDDAFYKFIILGSVYVFLIGVLLTLMVYDIRKTFKESKRKGDVIKLLFSIISRRRTTKV